MSVLGDVRLRNAAGRDLTPKPRKARALLAILALAPGMAASRERLAGLLWPDTLDAQARASLRQTLVQVRPLLATPDGDVMSISRDRIALATAQVLCDALSLLASLRSGDTATALAILTTWQGDYLADLAGINDMMADWVRSEQTAFETQVNTAAESRITQLVEQGAHDTVRALSGHLLGRMPGNEALVRAAMQADAALGDLPSLHKRFQTLRQTLAREFEAHPQAATRTLFAQLIQTSDGPTGAAAAPAAPAPGQRSGFGLPLVLVPPFQTAGLPDTAVSMLDGMKDEILTGLGRYRELRALVSETMPAAEDASWLGGDNQTFVLHVGARGADASYRLSARVTRLRDGQLLWSERFTLETLASWSAIDTITDRVLGAVLPALERFTLDRMPHGPNPATAYELYLAGRALARSPFDHHQGQQAIDLLEQAIALEPNLAEAYSQLSRLYNPGIIYCQTTAQLTVSRQKAFGYAQKALRLDRTNGRHHAGMGWCHLWRQDWALARQSFDTACTLSPNYAECLLLCAFGLLQLGDFERSEQLLQRCLALNPFPHDHYFIDLAWLETLRGKYDAASYHFSLVTKYDTVAHAYAAVCAVLSHDQPTAHLHASAIVEHVRSNNCTEGDMSPAALTSWMASYLPLRDTQLRDQVLDALRTAFMLSPPAV